MFDSFQFKEDLTYFQKLLGEGVLDFSLLEANLEECKTLKRLALSNLSKSKWVEHYNSLKVCAVDYCLDTNAFVLITEFIMILIRYHF